MRYRFNSESEPTDEQLEQIMRGVAEDAKEKSEKAHRQFFNTLKELTREDIQKELTAQSETKG